MLKEKFKKWVRKQWYRLTGKRQDSTGAGTTHYVTDQLKRFLWQRDDFRYNQLSEQAESSPKSKDTYHPADRQDKCKHESFMKEKHNSFIPTRTQSACWRYEGIFHKPYCIGVYQDRLTIKLPKEIT